MHGKTAALLALLVSLVLVALPARGDQVITVNGSTLRGQILKETARSVQIRDSRGLVVTVPRDEIEKIIREDNGAVFTQRFKTLKDDDADGLLKLAKWAKGNGLKDESRRCLKRVLAADTDQPVARKRLGYKKVDGRWLRGSALRAALGLVKYKGKWITEEARDRREKAATATSLKASSRSAGDAGARVRKTIILPDEDEDLLRIVRGAGPMPRRLGAARALSRKGSDAQAALRETLERVLAKSRKKLVGHFSNSKSKIRSKLAQRIVARRKVAHRIIFDKAKYPDANHGAAGQHLVDAAVGKLLRAYDDPLGEMQNEDKVSKLFAKVTQASGWLRQFCGAPINDATLIRELRGEIAKEIDMRRFPVNGTDGKILRKSQEIQRTNDKVRSSLTTEERACVDATNAYRMMFGLKALKAFEPLVQAARKHSVEMVERRYFDHTSPNPATRTPAMRCRAEGASFSGENIAMGMRSGVGAFNAWYTSSGHHRNMLEKTHRSIGIGQSGKYWTQNFGYDSPK